MDQRVERLGEDAMFQVSNEWKQAFPGAHAGIIVLRAVSNPPYHAELEKRRQALEEQLRILYRGMDRKALEQQPVLQAYQAYYRRFKKTYHVQLQLESILLKGKSIPQVAALVQAMFMAELEDGLLTAGHDLTSLRLPITLDVANGTEHYPVLRGEEQALKAGDMMMRDDGGVISSILYGPDRRTAIRSETKDVIFTTYAPSGILPQTVKTHLVNIQQNVLVFSPNARTEALEVVGDIA